MALQDSYNLVIWNVTTPSSAGAICAAQLARPTTGNISNPIFPTDNTVELFNDVEWIWAMG